MLKPIVTLFDIPVYISSDFSEGFIYIVNQYIDDIEMDWIEIKESHEGE